MDKKINNSSSGSKFLGSLMNRLPYASSIFNTIDNVNPKYKDFAKIDDKQRRRVAKNSIYDASQGNQHSAGIMSEQGYSDFVYAEVDPNKIKRIQSYRQMAAFAELSDAIDEICDEAVSTNLKGDVISLALRNDDLSSNARKEIRKEWDKINKLLDLEDKGWDYYRQLLIEGELIFENIIAEGREKKDGIIGLRLIPTELADPVYKNKQNNDIEGFTLLKIDPNTPNITEDNYIPLDKNQITYISSGIWNEDKSIRLPYIENSRRAYKQLTLIEDSIIIYRIVRAPERLVFKVDVGTMSAANAEAYIKKLMQQYWSRRSFSGNDGHVTNTYEPQSMLDAYWFPRRGDSEGISVDQLQGGANLGELSDLNYFLDKLYKTLKVPTSRRNPESATSASAEEITREELRFAKFIIRIQKRFAEGIKRCFINHLKLLDLWETYELEDADLKIEFSTPTNFQVMRNQQTFGLLANNFSELAGNESIASTFAQRHYLKLTDEEIIENREWQRKDANFRWELAQIEAAGPDWKELQDQATDISPELGGGDLGGGGGGLGGDIGGGEIPDFGAAPEIADDTQEAVPEEPAEEI